MGRQKRSKKLEEVKKVLEDQKTSKKYEDNLEVTSKKQVTGHLIGDKVIIKDDFESALEYYDRGCFGEIHGVKEKHLELALTEALYLVERKKLKVLDSRSKVLTFEQFSWVYYPLCSQVTRRSPD